MIENCFLQKTFIDIYCSFQTTKYQFEIGGRNKSYEQIKDLNHSYVALDGIESGFGNKIPLWLFGFLY
jgi:hypothetical protein